MRYIYYTYHLYIAIHAQYPAGWMVMSVYSTSRPTRFAVCVASPLIYSATVLLFYFNYHMVSLLSTVCRLCGESSDFLSYCLVMLLQLPYGITTFHCLTGVHTCLIIKWVCILGKL